MANNLPKEMLEQILLHLPPRQRLTTRLVCRHWLEVSNLLLEEIECVIRGPEQYESLYRRCVFSRLCFCGVYINDGCAEFLNRYGQQVRHLRFQGCKVLTESLVHCPGLLSLQVDWPEIRGRENSFTDTNRSELLLFSALPSLVALKIDSVTHFTDERLLAIDRTSAPHLEEFSMPFMRPTAGSYRMEGGSLIFQPFPPCVSYAALEAFVRHRAATLTTLHLPEKMTVSERTRISRLEGLNLKSVSFPDCEGLLKFCRNQRGIVSLEVRGLNNHMTELQVEGICRLLPALREFSGPIYHFHLIRLMRMLPLRSLRLSSCLEVDPLEIYSWRDLSPPLPDLRTLDLHSTEFQDKHIHNLLTRTPLLEELNLASTDVSSCTLTLVCPLLPNLRVLKLVNCTNITDQGLIALKKLTRLERLDLSNCLKITSRGVKAGIQFQHLWELGLVNCPRVFPPVKKSLYKQNKCLKTLRWCLHS